MHTIEADYLVVGAGAMGMAFLDTLVSETEARVVVVVTATMRPVGIGLPRIRSSDCISRRHSMASTR